MVFHVHLSEALTSGDRALGLVLTVRAVSVKIRAGEPALGILSFGANRLRVQVEREQQRGRSMS